MPSDSARILTVRAGSPADSAGIRAGDRIVAIEGQTVSNAKDASILLFGLAGTAIRVRASRLGVETEYVIIRAPYSKVFGQAPPK